MGEGQKINLICDKNVKLYIVGGERTLEYKVFIVT